MTTITELLEQVNDKLLMAPCNRCRDFDEDCAGVENKFACWTYDPDKGWCPYLRKRGETQT